MATVQSSILPPIDPITFWSHVKRCRHRKNCDRCCWPWRSARPGQYGQITIGHQRYLVHRVALQLTHGLLLIPALFICHTCDNPPCCNPSHLYAGTFTDNMRDRRTHGAYAPATRAGYATADRAALHDWLTMTDSRLAEPMLQTTKEYELSIDAAQTRPISI